MSSEWGPTCAAQSESSCPDFEQCIPLYGRVIDACSGDGIPVCESAMALEYLGCITFTICKPGINFYSDGADPPRFYVTTGGCVPYGFERVEVSAWSDAQGGDDLPPTCGEGW